MKVESISIKGFRCFGETGQTISFDNLTCLVGPNASGKTAAMAALVRMFGEIQSDRSMKASDFHLMRGEQLASVQERNLSLEVKLVFPELEGNGSADVTIPETFNQMIVDEPCTTPYCRICLDAVWMNDGTLAGDVQQKLSWILTPSDDPTVIAESKRSLTSAERSRVVRVIYIPAARDPSSQIRTTTTTAFGRLLRALEWGGKDEDIRARLVDLKQELGLLPGVGTMNASVQAVWSRLYDGRVATNVAFESVDADPAALLDLLAPIFVPDEQGQQMRTADLSDGLRSLFALSLPVGLYGVEEQLKTKAAAAGFRSSIADGLPLLTLFAVEEPENHLSPHYLGKVVRELNKAAKTGSAQVVLSSHSPAIMNRIEPDQVRYFFGGEVRLSTEVRSLILPTESEDEAFKYVREAVRGYPELYFSRLVVLGEGPSEEIVLRRIFEASGAPLDVHFVSIVPLGGRHVHHFWRLLNGLGIPFITLLDLDREKEGAGWGRIQYVRNELVALYGEPSEKLNFIDDQGAQRNLAKPTFADLGKKSDRDDLEAMEFWLRLFQERFDIFFSAPLDIDLSMLECFPGAYKNQAPSGGGPRLPKDESSRSIAVRSRMRQVLTADVAKAHPETGASYSPDQIKLFPWYKYLFVDGSKPVAHMRALIALEDTDWVEMVPEVLTALVTRARQLVGSDANPVK